MQYIKSRFDKSYHRTFPAYLALNSSSGRQRELLKNFDTVLFDCKWKSLFKREYLEASVIYPGMRKSRLLLS